MGVGVAAVLLLGVILVVTVLIGQTWWRGWVAMWALVSLPVVVLFVRASSAEERARQGVHDSRLERLGALGGGDPALGERMLDCDRRVRPLLVQVATLNRQLSVVTEARLALAQSRFQDRVALYDSAAAVLQRQIDARHSLLDEFAAYRLDLEALAAALRAEHAFKPLDPLADEEGLEVERRRLTAEADALEAADEAAQELRALGL